MLYQEMQHVVDYNSMKGNYFSVGFLTNITVTTKLCNNIFTIIVIHQRPTVARLYR